MRVRLRARMMRESGSAPLAAMLIKVTDPASIDELIRFLSGIGFSAHQGGLETVRIDPGTEPRVVARQQLEIYLQLWQATRPEVSAVVDSDVAESTDEASTQPCDVSAEPVPDVKAASGP
jgi:hypothetical protein